MKQKKIQKQQKREDSLNRAWKANILIAKTEVKKWKLFKNYFQKKTGVSRRFSGDKSKATNGLEEILKNQEAPVGDGNTAEK